MINHSWEIFHDLHVQFWFRIFLFLLRNLTFLLNLILEHIRRWSCSLKQSSLWSESILNHGLLIQCFSWEIICLYYIGQLVLNKKMQIITLIIYLYRTYIPILIIWILWCFSFLNKLFIYLLDLLLFCYQLVLLLFPLSNGYIKNLIL